MVGIVECVCLWNVWLESLTEHDDGREDIFVLYENAFWNEESNGGEVPDTAHAAIDHEIGDVLSVFLGHGDDADVDATLACAFWKFGDVIGGYADEIASDFVFVGVESGEYFDAVRDDALVSEECGAEVSGTGEECVARFVPTDESFECNEEVLSDESCARTPC